MALSITEASAVNTLLRFVTNTARPGSGHVAPEEALTAGDLLAQKANKTLMAGFRGDGDLAQVWPCCRGYFNGSGVECDATCGCTECVIQKTA